MGFVAHFGGRFVSVQSWDCIPNLGMWDEKISNHNNEWMSECFGIKEASRFMPDRILSLIALFMRITWSYIILRPSYPPPLSWIGRRHEWLHENSRGKWGRKHIGAVSEFEWGKAAQPGKKGREDMIIWCRGWEDGRDQIPWWDQLLSNGEHLFTILFELLHSRLVICDGIDMGEQQAGCMLMKRMRIEDAVNREWSAVCWLTDGTLADGGGSGKRSYLRRKCNKWRLVLGPAEGNRYAERKLGGETNLRVHIFNQGDLSIPSKHLHE